MKVIKEEVWWQFTCSVCKSVCQAEPNDADSRPNIDHEGDEIGRIYTVKCGKCGKDMDIPHDKITGKIEQIAQRKLKRR